MVILRKLMLNWANRLDPKYIIVFCERSKVENLNVQSISFKKLTSLGIKFEKFNSVMMVKHTCKELKDQNIVHFTIERW